MDKKQWERDWSYSCLRCLDGLEELTQLLNEENRHLVDIGLVARQGETLRSAGEGMLILSSLVAIMRSKQSNRSPETDSGK